MLPHIPSVLLDIPSYLVPCQALRCTLCCSPSSLLLSRTPPLLPNSQQTFRPRPPFSSRTRVTPCEKRSTYVIQQVGPTGREGKSRSNVRLLLIAAIEGRGGGGGGDARILIGKTRLYSAASGRTTVITIKTTPLSNQHQNESQIKDTKKGNVRKDVRAASGLHHQHINEAEKAASAGQWAMYTCLPR